MSRPSPRKSSSSNRPRQSRGGKKTPSSSAKPTKLRVIGGDLRGRPIEYHGADFTRPMKDNIRENLFNILGRAVRGSIAMDLFSGTGALALESISRGAQSAVAIEQHKHAAAVIRGSGEKLGVGERLKVLCGDAFQLTESLLVPPTNDTPWIVFVCPPYVLWHEQLPALNLIIQRTLDHAPPGSVLVAETEKSFDQTALPDGDWDCREYGGTRLAIIEPASRCGLDLGGEDLFGDGDTCS